MHGMVIFIPLLTFIIGIVIGISIAGPVIMAKRRIGYLEIDDKSDPEKILYSFRFDVIDLDQIPKNDYVSVKTKVIFQEGKE